MKICCVGYRDWAIEIYDQLDYSGFDILIMKEYEVTAGISGRRRAA